MEVTTSFPPLPFPTWPWHSNHTWVFSALSGAAENCSQLYYCRTTNTVRFVLNTHEAIHGVIIPCDSGVDASRKLQVIRLKNFNFHPRASFGFRYFSLGYNSAILNGGVHPVHMLYYSWPDDSHTRGPSNSLIVKFGKKIWMDERCSQAFDEGSGRVVVEFQDEILVYDLAKFKKCI